MTIKSRPFNGSLLARTRPPREGRFVDALEELSPEQRAAFKQAVWRKIYGIPKPAEAAKRATKLTSVSTAVKPLLKDMALVRSTPSTEPAANLEVPKPKQGPKRSGPELICLDQPGYLRLDEVLVVFPVSRAAWYEGVKQGIYPAPIALGKRSVGYKTSDIKKLIESPADFCK